MIQFDNIPRVRSQQAHGSVHTPLKTFSDLGLLPELLRALTDSSYENPTPIQAQAIPVALKGVDLLGIAQTGTGKTAGFLLPTLQRLHLRGGKGKLRALVLTPTRELAAQIGDSARTYGKHLQLRHTVVFGGVGFTPQQQKLRQGVDVLIATPGRLLDHMEQRTVNLSGIEILILDEADRMCDMGFLPDVRRILKALPAQRQTLFFSATMPDEIERLSHEMLRSPVTVEAGHRSRPVDAVRQIAYAVPGDLKKEAVAHLLAQDALRHVLVFTRTKARADRLAKYLNRTGRSVAAIHGNKSQNARTQALGGFKTGKVDVLVATDIAARGIDVDGISHVINFDLPNVPEDYVHRIGRTARAEATGDAISLVAPEEYGYVRNIERLTGIAIPRQVLAGFDAQAVRLASPREADDRTLQYSRHGSRSPRSQGGFRSNGGGSHGRKPHGNSRPHSGGRVHHGRSSAPAAVGGGVAVAPSPERSATVQTTQQGQNKPHWKKARSRRFGGQARSW